MRDRLDGPPRGGRPAPENDRKETRVIKVLLLDDHAVVRAGYRRWIDETPDLRVVAEAATSAQACEAVRDQSIDVAVVDLALREDSGLEVIRRIRARSPRTRMLVFTMFDHAAHALQALRLGAHGYLTKDHEPQAVLQALRHIAAGGRVFSPAVLQSWATDSAGQGLNPLSVLTPREFEVLRLATDGLATRTIADALHVSEKTVHNTLSLVRQKLNTRSDFALMRLVAEHGLVPPQG
jgi:DNA-binding NarL/FixJ family response regulator